VNGLCPVAWLNEQFITMPSFQSALVHMVGPLATTAKTRIMQIKNQAFVRILLA